jgi:Flp pilus assembly protein TadD
MLGVVMLGGCTGHDNGYGTSAVDQASSAGASNPASGAGVLNVADAAIAGGDPGMALKVSQSVLASDPHNLQALYHEAAAYYAVDRCEDAIAAYTLALGIDPHSADAETGIGRCLLKRNAVQAEQAFAAAVADDPTNAAAQNDLGIARDLTGDFAGAAQPYQQALLLSPGNTATEVNLGLSLALSGDPDDALQYLGPLANGPSATPKIREDYATALLAAGRQSDARQVLAIDVPPGQLDDAMATLSSLIAEPPEPAPTPAAAIPAAVTPVAAALMAVVPVAAVATIQAQPAAPLPAATPPLPVPTPTPVAAEPLAVPPSAALMANAEPVATEPAPAATPLPVSAAFAAPPSNPNVSLPLADTVASNATEPTAPGAVVALAPAISGPEITAPPAPSLAPTRH